MSDSEMLGANVLSDLDALQLPSILQVATPWGTEALQTQLQNPKHTLLELKRIQTPLLALRHPNTAPQLTLIQSEIQKCIAPHCALVNELATPQNQESISQILWDPKSHFASLNTRPSLISGLLNWKTVLVPLFSVVMPIIAMIVPFFLIRFFHGQEAMGVHSYITHVRQTILRQITIPAILRAKHDSDIFGKITETLVLLLTLGTFCMGLWNQIQSALHLRRIAADLKHRGTAIQEIIASSERIIGVLESLPRLQQKGLASCIKQGKQALAVLQGFPGGLAGFGIVWNEPIVLNPLKSWIGMLDAQVSLASLPSICFPRYKQGSSLTIKGLYHPCLPTEKVVLNDAQFTEKHHAILTGPNRGGKSTFCKSLGLSILWAQSWGIAWAQQMTLDPFQYIETALKPTDVLGRLSLFETEIEFAKQVLIQSETSQRTFVMMDEIFHSTNAHDGFAASRIFLKRLYACSETVSLISTHYRDLVAEFSDCVFPWHMMTTDNSDGSLCYSYKCATGISDKSSVLEILKERGLTTT